MQINTEFSLEHEEGEWPCLRAMSRLYILLLLLLLLLLYPLMLHFIIILLSSVMEYGAKENVVL